MVTVDEQGRLNGLIIVDDPHSVPAKTIEEWRKNYITPGLNSLVIRSSHNFAQESADAPHPDLIIPTSCGTAEEIAQ